MENIIIYAKPSATDVKPYSYFVFPLLSSKQNSISLNGKSFFALRNLYLSASDISAYNGLEYSFYNPFSAISNLADKNPGFIATVIPSFIQLNDSQIVFDIPQQIFDYVSSKNSSYQIYLDVIIENEAGYGLLTRDSYSYSVSSWSGFQQTQKPCINGISIEKP